MARLDIYLAGYDVTDEVINRSSTSSLKLDHDTIRGTADIEIWTGAGGTGTQLALTTDYTVAGEDTRLSTAVGGGISVYTTLAIVNGAYHSTPLYVSYKTVGDYASVSSSRLIQIGYKEITGNYTVTANDRTIIVNTASAVTITLPEGLPIGSDIDIMRLVASTNAVTVARSGSETIEGGTSFVTHGAYASSFLNDSMVSLQKKSSTSWKFVSGIISGSTSDGRYEKHSNGIMHQWVYSVLSSVVFTLAASPIAQSSLITPANWPLSFTAIKSGTIMQQYGTSTAWVIMSTTDATTSTPPLYYMYRVGAGTVTTIKTVAYGEGTWK